MNKAEITTKVNEYLENKTSDFSKPICEKLRQIYLDCGMQEEFKWGAPCYSHHGLVCNIGAFKKHVASWFFQGSLLSDPEKVLIKNQDQTKALRCFKFVNISEVNENIVRMYAQEAMLLNEKGIKVDYKKVREELIVPEEFEKRLKQNKKAWQHFQDFSYSKKKDYTTWISSAKREETKEKRIKQALEMLAKGIGKNDKYMNC